MKKITVKDPETHSADVVTENLQKMIEQRTHEEGIVPDFFTGSGTTDRATMWQNAVDGGNWRDILVQLSEPLDPTNKNQKTSADFCDKLCKSRNIAELPKECLRHAVEKTKNENFMFAGDLGFRVFKLDTSNIGVWDPDRNAPEKPCSTPLSTSNRSEQDLLHELLPKLGLDL